MGSRFTQVLPLQYTVWTQNGRTFIIFLVQVFESVHLKQFPLALHVTSVKRLATCEKTVATNLKGLYKCRFSNAIHPLERNFFVTSQSRYLKVCLVESTSAAWLTMTRNGWVFLTSQIMKRVVS